MNIYKKKRLKSGLTQSDIALKLGLSLNRYKAIENGIVKMPTDLIDTFHTIVDSDLNGVEILNKREYIEDWFSNLQQNEDGQYKNIKELMNKFNIKSFKQLGKCLGYKDDTLCCKYIGGKLETPYAFKNKLYNFFTDEKNIQIPKVVEEPKTSDDSTTELEKWFYNFDFNGFLKANNLSKNQVSRDTGVSISTLTKLQTGDFKYKTNLESIAKLYGYCTNFNKNSYEAESINEEELTEELPSIPETTEKVEDYVEVNRLTDNRITMRIITGKTSTDIDFNANVRDLIKKYENTVDEIQKDINQYQDILIGLEKQLPIYATLINDLKNIIGDNDNV